MTDLKKYSVHHLGIAKTIPDFKMISHGKDVKIDHVQGVSTLFVKDDLSDCYLEYFTISGRPSNYEPGFNHVCYRLPNESGLLAIKVIPKNNKFWVQPTKLEKSGSKECNRVKFSSLPASA